MQMRVRIKDDTKPFYGYPDIWTITVLFRISNNF